MIQARINATNSEARAAATLRLQNSTGKNNLLRLNNTQLPLVQYLRL